VTYNTFAFKSPFAPCFCQLYFYTFAAEKVLGCPAVCKVGLRLYPQHLDQGYACGRENYCGITSSTHHAFSFF
jgi:hypothetical protein